MGCTSSVPNTLSATASKDKSIQFEEDVVETFTRQVEAFDTESENRTEIKVLPPSDTAESSELVRNNKSTTSLQPEKDLNTNGHRVESESSDTTETTKEFKNDEIDDKMSKLKLEVVGKFFEITQQEKNPDTFIDDPNPDETVESTKKENEDTDVKEETESEVNGEDNETNSEEAEEASPSQSQSSRATRWEALADIAAELPPSLAVDPLTGQIYSLSK